MVSFAYSWRAGALLAVAISLAVTPVAAQTESANRCGSPIAQHLQLDVANPSPGATLLPGSVVIEGVAFDRLAQSGTGVERVSIFLDGRDSGGIHLADATLDLPNTMRPDSRFATAGYSAMIDLPEQSGPHTLDIHAHSSVTGQEMVVTVPFVLDDDATADATCSAASIGEPQLPAPAGESESAVTAVAGVTAAAPAPTTLPAEQTPIHLEVTNPLVGALVPAGSYDLRVIAFDPGATDGSGIDNISFFVGDQNEGGQVFESFSQNPALAQRELNLRVDIPDRPGGRDLVVYARAPNGRTAVLRVPIMITD